MPTASIRTSFRPARIGFLVEVGDIPGLVRVAGINTLLWGGVHNPIIPVSNGGAEFSKQLVHLFRVDILHAIDESEHAAALKAEFPFLRAPKLHAENLFVQDWKSKRMRLAYLDSLNIIDCYWNREFKHKPEDYKSNCVLPHWHPDDPLSALFSLQLGAFPSDLQLENDFERAYVRGLCARELDLETGGVLPAELATRVSPIQMTGMELAGRASSYSRDGSGVYVGDPASFEDLVNFWNLRAAGYSVVFLPVDCIERARAFVAEHLARLDDVPDSHPNIRDFLSFHMPERLDAQAKDVINGFETKRDRVQSPVSTHSWNGLNVKPRSYHFSSDTCLAPVDKERGQYRVALPLPEKRFLTNDGRLNSDQVLAISLRFYSEFEYPGNTLHPPMLPELNEFYSRKISFDPWTVRVEPEGIGLMIDVGDAVEHLSPIPHKDVLIRLFKFAGLVAKSSQAGLIATRIIEQLEGIEGARVFKISGVRNLIRDLSADKSVPRATAIQTIWEDGQFRVHENLYIEPRQHKNLQTNDVFDFLLKKDFFRGGLELTCQGCKLENWLSLKEIDDKWLCQYCGHEDRLSSHIRHRGDWRFRKSGLLGKDNNQEGAIPVILTLLCLNRVMHGPEILLTTALHLAADGRTCEVDFAFLDYSIKFGERRLQMAIGESKAAGGEITEQDVENMCWVRDHLEDHHIDCYLVFSKTSDDFTESELALFKGLREKEIFVILLTNRELEPYEPYLESDDEKLPDKYAHGLQEMARNSEARYLLE